jgi:hypothetical protein
VHGRSGPAQLLTIWTNSRHQESAVEIVLARQTQQTLSPGRDTYGLIASQVCFGSDHVGTRDLDLHVADAALLADDQTTTTWFHENCLRLDCPFHQPLVVLDRGPHHAGEGHDQGIRQSGRHTYCQPFSNTAQPRWRATFVARLGDFS